MFVAACQTTSTHAPSTSTSTASGTGPADLVLTHAHVWTADAQHPWADAVAIRGGRIVAVGTADDVKSLTGPATQVRDLKGQMVLPGFVDAHVHPLGAGRQEQGCALVGLHTVESIQAKVKECADATKGKPGFLTGRGWDLSVFPQANPNKSILDAVVPDRPAYFRGEDGHSGWANSKALAAAGITKDTKNPPQGIIERDSKGEPTGTLREAAADLIEALLPEPTVDDDVAALRIAMKHVSEAGITSIMDAGIDERRMETYRILSDKGELPAHVVGCFVVDPTKVDETVAEAKALRSKYEKLAGVQLTCAKIYLDGVLEGETAALQQPYKDHPETSGQLNAEPAVLNALVQKLDAAGFQVHMHVIGDRAVHVALDAYAYAEKQNGKKDLRPTLAHIQLVDPIDYTRFAALGVVANAQAFWAYPDTYIQNINTPQVGDERVARMYPYGSLKRGGAHIVGGSDWPVSSLNPLDAIEVMLTRQDPALNGGPVLNAHEALDVETALRAFTSEGAYLLHSEADTGTVSVGRAADLVVVDHDLTKIDPHAVSESHVTLTLLGGRVVFERP
jgi:hypothetical protein